MAINASPARTDRRSMKADIAISSFGLPGLAQPDGTDAAVRSCGAVFELDTVDDGPPHRCDQVFTDRLQRVKAQPSRPDGQRASGQKSRLREHVGIAVALL